MRIAVASQDGLTVAGDIGRWRKWVVFEIEAIEGCDDRVKSVPQRLKPSRTLILPKAMVLHHYREDQPHPLADCDAVIGAISSESVVRRMARRGVDAVATAETDLYKAISDYIKRQITPPQQRFIDALIYRVRAFFSAGL
ncbi:NifB/NifX family molybdenum-iron cluster-binding protein [Amphritea sp.]|uniref:NifB/NifX family molybdenum-iron cluster-binding protein n=1 Tax=Amphritea sp. TaxID=1872502 RepID=UPI003D0A62C0